MLMVGLVLGHGQPPHSCIDPSTGTPIDCSLLAQ